MRAFKCKECGFIFGLAADFENMSEEEYKEVTKCPCGAQMEETEHIMGCDYGEEVGDRLSFNNEFNTYMAEGLRFLKEEKQRETMTPKEYGQHLAKKKKRRRK